MITEVKTFRIKCDRCAAYVDVKHFHSGDPELPDGWKRVRSHGWGSTNYSRDEELCSVCAIQSEP